MSYCFWCAVISHLHCYFHFLCYQLIYQFPFTRNTSLMYSCYGLAFCFVCYFTSINSHLQGDALLFESFEHRFQLSVAGKRFRFRTDLVWVEMCWRNYYKLLMALKLRGGKNIRGSWSAWNLWKNTKRTWVFCPAKLTN